ncbi:Adenosylcobinamide amidohydrolase [Halanaeroarchaeum sp. HSR-CO]|uniref:adenosylcobinamide amidohydrolase n=1 Tax=Halanaeroarchaeum sp. HSR-CO TaxID=2866382 RepID=UPI00217E3337|nr:adenosylcobinamide amidohydrolase [Halanaeroarchaeum sp. HSR-CO]UWG46791.1 Adenosylcobinamide amidohydrolase [Halanaeroarchaeum sp. HSR-CO]
MFDPTVREGVLQVRRSGTRWLSTGWAGGFETAGAAYNVSVPEGWERTDLGAYVDERRERAAFDVAGPALLTGVDLTHLRGARSGPVEVFATAGVSNPAALPMAPEEGAAPATDAAPTGDHAGTVNLIVGTTRALDDAAVANLLSVAVEAKTATLLATTGYPGTTTDAVIVGTDPAGEPAPFSGSATEVGAAARACVRDAIRASLDSRYEGGELPASVAEADHGVETTRRASVFVP